jgi:integrase
MPYALDNGAFGAGDDWKEGPWVKLLDWARLSGQRPRWALSTIPLNSALLQALVEYSEWYIKRFGPIQPGWYVFPFGKPRPHDPTRPIVTLKTSWGNAWTKAKVQGRWHDSRHTLITDLAESGAGDETIRDIAGHVSKQMLKHYSHIRMEAKRRAVESIVRKPDAKSPAAPTSNNNQEPIPSTENKTDAA